MHWKKYFLLLPLAFFAIIAIMIYVPQVPFLWLVPIVIFWVGYYGWVFADEKKKGKAEKIEK
ncbi:hypothetical protein JOC78_002139 [Bacillus ectoiniformans]|uniref:hypothetical protein n=1 Tax=Bacillus ectoiniformans TaxID=1494429 RepID=UPI0019582344|nr:hypothetical protein [Bacillus ectoiniformans]MBM7649186.1 hypothetical protein [Bacillus ectoiniformans]